MDKVLKSESNNCQSLCLTFATEGVVCLFRYHSLNQNIPGGPAASPFIQYNTIFSLTPLNLPEREYRNSLNLASYYEM
jgi:hypothetical protein